MSENPIPSTQDRPPRSRIWFRIVIGLVLLLAAVALCYPLLALVLEDWQGTFYNQVSLGDLDGDGDLDAAVINLRQEAPSVSWTGILLWVNDGSGNFTPRDGEGEPQLGGAAALGDLDGDGDLDLAGINDYTIRRYVNQGRAQGGLEGQFRIHGGNLLPGKDYGTWRQVVLADLNGDGFDDGLVAGCSRDYVEFSDLPSYSWGWISESQAASHTWANIVDLKHLGNLCAWGIALADLDADGDLDAFVAVQGKRQGQLGDPGERVWWNDGQGNFSDSGQRLGTDESLAVALADLDGDGDPDALVGTLNGAQVWLNQGGGQAGQRGVFAPGQTFASGETRYALLADLDGDGDPDALLGGISEAVIWWNDGAGRFERSDVRLRFTGRKPYGLAVGDLNGDGWIDILGAEYNQRIKVWLNQGGGTFK